MTFLRGYLTPLNIVLLVLLAAATIAGFLLVPPGTNLPIHWGLNGNPNSFQPRDRALLIFPALAIVLSGVLTFVRRFDKPEASGHVLRIVVSCVLAMFLVLEVATVMIGVGIAVDMIRVVTLGVGALFVVVGNALPKTQPNHVAGIRLPWTLRDPANWQATNRLGGILMMAGGVVMMAAGLTIAMPGMLLSIMFAVLVLSMGIPTIYSWRLSRRRRT